jgi:hypothetical protein
MEPITHLDYPLNTELLLEEAREAKKSAINHFDPRYPDMKFDEWLIGHYTSEYINKVMDDFGIKGKPRFFWLEPFAFIPEHTDNGTQCSLNFLLNSNPAAITINGKDYFYQSVLLDTTQPHSVTNNETERLLFKISIFDESYESVANRIKYKK